MSNFQEQSISKKLKFIQEYLGYYWYTLRKTCGFIVADILFLHFSIWNNDLSITCKMKIS